MQERSSKGFKKIDALDKMIEKITVDAYGDDEQLQAFRHAFEDNVALPADGFVIGEPVSVIGVDYDGNQRRGLTARCRRDDGYEYAVAVCDVVLPQTSAGAPYIAAYRKWLNLEPYPAETQKPSPRGRQHKVADDEIDMSKPVEMVALAVKERTVRCRLLESDRVLTLRATRLWEVVPGSILTVTPRKQWRFSGHPYLSGDIQSIRIDVKALDLIPLGLEYMDMWDPNREYWGDEDEANEQWVRTIIAHGPRPMYEMEQVLPGEDPDDLFNDPITISNDLKDAGKGAEAIQILMELCQADLRCLDAHSHLGTFIFHLRPKDAIRHYEVGLRIGELSLGDDFTGVLPWSLINNRPFLRCMHGYGLCLWRLGQFEEAEHIFEQILWLNPVDNQGVRFLIGDMKAKKSWEDSINE